MKETLECLAKNRKITKSVMTVRIITSYENS